MIAADLGPPCRGTGRRLLFWVFVGGSTAASSCLLGYTLLADGISTTEWAFLALFVPLFACLAISFWIAMVGTWVLLGSRRPALRRPPVASAAALGSRTAIIMPIHNEEVARVFAGMKAVYESVARTGFLSSFDFFILSDTTDPDLWVEEEVAWSRLCAEVAGDGTCFYRRRQVNSGRKSGNVADFCEHWGSRYDHMLVLDADSLMSGWSLVALAAMMEANPRAGIIQAAPRLFNAGSLFARLHQFAHNLYSPVFVAGIAYLQLRDGNYWGHNAIVRMRPFMDNCRLPVLPGRQPLGGEIMSHDSVEAALMRRAGWEVWLVHDVEGSYESGPPTLIDYAKRDRRWCAGNIQNLRLLFARGFLPVSRAQLAMGAVSYALAPLCLSFLAVNVLVAMERAQDQQVQVFGRGMMPVWPVSRATESGLLLAVTFAMLLLPKLLALGLAARRPGGLGGYGGAFAALRSVGLEIVSSMFIAPIVMAFQSQAVVQVLMGRKAVWEAQRRGGGPNRLADAVAAHAGHTAAAIVAALLAWLTLPEVGWWLVPVLAGLGLSIPISLVTGSVAAGQAARARGLFLTPEETEPTQELARFGECLAAGRAAADGPPIGLAGFLRAVVDPRVNALHRAILAAAPGLPERPVVDDLLVARCERHDVTRLTREEKLILLSDAGAMRRLHRTAWMKGGVESLWRSASAADRRRVGAVLDADVPAGEHDIRPRLGAALERLMA